MSLPNFERVFTAAQPTFAFRKDVIRIRLKRWVDVTGAAILLFALLPFFLVVAIALSFENGPVFFSHRRVGQGGREFGCLKFRTMRPDAERTLQQYLEANPAAHLEWEASRKLRNDPRITQIGQLLRSTSLDELPQLINVLRGEMSLVGPRPVVQDELDKYYRTQGADLRYISVRPGITGPWQVGGRSNTSYQARVVQDSDYVRTLSLRKDMLILIRTFAVVLQRRGAY